MSEPIQFGEFKIGTSPNVPKGSMVFTTEPESIVNPLTDTGRWTLGDPVNVFTMSSNVDPLEDASWSVTNPEDETPYVGRCTECRLRANGVQHYHDIFSVCLAGQEHRAWFPGAFLKDLLNGMTTLNFRSWSAFIRPGQDGKPDETFIKLTIYADDNEPADKIHSWKLTDTVDQHGKRLGIWPD